MIALRCKYLLKLLKFQAEQRLAEENRRVEVYLHASTLFKVMKTCETVLIQKQLDTLHQEFRSLLMNEKKDDLGRMYQLVSRLEDALGDMKEHLETHICTQGLNAIEEIGETGQNVSYSSHSCLT